MELVTPYPPQFALSSHRVFPVGLVFKECSWRDADAGYRVILSRTLNPTSIDNYSVLLAHNDNFNCFGNFHGERMNHDFAENIFSFLSQEEFEEFSEARPFTLARLSDRCITQLLRTL